MKSILPEFRIFSLANHADLEAGIIGLANDFQMGDDNWVQIAPYGEFPHPGPMGKNGKRLVPNGCLQRLDNAAAETMAKDFNSPLARIGRKLRGEAPWYVGHHDIDPIKYPDPNAYGWIKALANRQDGLYAQVEWTPAGQKLIDDKSFKYFSPYWDVKETKQKDPQGRTIVAPSRLNSVGFTNKPNIPVLPLANEDGPTIPGTDDAAEMLVHHYASLGVIKDSEREEWIGYFNEDFQSAAWALANVDWSLANADRSEAARKGWITRRANMGAAAQKAPKAAAKAAAKTMKKSRTDATREKHQKVLDEARAGKRTFSDPEFKAAKKYMATKNRASGRAKAAQFSAKSPAEKEKIVKAQVAKQNADISNTDRHQPKPPPLPQKATPPPLPPRKPAAVRPQQLSTTLPGGTPVPYNPHAMAAAHTIRYGNPNPFL